LDPAGRDELLDVLKEFVKGGNRSILLSSHITSDIEKIADSLIFIKGGKILLKIDKQILLEQYGILQCQDYELDQLDDHFIIAIKNNGDMVDVLVSDRHQVPQSMQTKKFTIDDITLLLMRGEKA